MRGTSQPAANVEGVLATESAVFIQAAFFVCATAALACLGGLAVLLFVDFVSPRDLIPPVLALFLSSALAARLGLSLYRRNPKTFLFSSALFTLMAAGTLSFANVAGSFLIPRWPTIGLHGVPPAAGRATWGRHDAEGVGFNSWGQQDRERTLAPAPGVFRIAFVGDSFLEETSLKVSVRTEDKLAGKKTEIINLGIANTAPDEYFYRIKNIALPLGARHCYMFVYAGNDFIYRPSIKSFWGIAAAYPRDSLLSALHLTALNHALTNRTRPILQAWWNAQELGEVERLRASLAAGSDDRMRSSLLTFVPPASRARLAAVLARPEMRIFFDMLRHPDEGLFRSYMIDAAFRCAVGEKTRYLPIDERWTYAWVKRAADACRRRNAEFTLVLVPEAFQVDDRMRAEYAPVADMRELFRTRREASNRLVSRAREEHIDVVDLQKAMAGTSGLYLNLDGHWSPAGVEFVSSLLAVRIRTGERGMKTL